MPNNITPDASANLELLKRAAKAAGIGLEWPQDFGGADFLSPRKTSDWQLWNPLTYDGDALQLAVKLGLVVCVMREAGFTGVYLPAEHIGGKYDEVEMHGIDPCAATRRAIVRAAAAA